MAIRCYYEADMLQRAILAMLIFAATNAPPITFQPTAPQALIEALLMASITAA